jgi:hypothetical protein
MLTQRPAHLLLWALRSTTPLRQASSWDSEWLVE